MQINYSKNEMQIDNLISVFKTIHFVANSVTALRSVMGKGMHE